MKKRILSVLLALCMCLTFVPVTVLAEDLQQGNGYQCPKHHTG